MSSYMRTSTHRWNMRLKCDNTIQLNTLLWINYMHLNNYPVHITIILTNLNNEWMLFDISCYTDYMCSIIGYSNMPLIKSIIITVPTLALTKT